MLGSFCTLPVPEAMQSFGLLPATWRHGYEVKWEFGKIITNPPDAKWLKKEMDTLPREEDLPASRRRNEGAIHALWRFSLQKGFPLGDHERGLLHLDSEGCAALHKALKEEPQGPEGDLPMSSAVKLVNLVNPTVGKGESLQISARSAADADAAEYCHVLDDVAKLAPDEGATWVLNPTASWWLVPSEEMGLCRLVLSQGQSVTLMTDDQFFVPVFAAWSHASDQSSTRVLMTCVQTVGYGAFGPTHWMEDKQCADAARRSESLLETPDVFTTRGWKGTVKEAAQEKVRSSSFVISLPLSGYAQNPKTIQ